jgi:hypothetical protein
MPLSLVLDAAGAVQAPVTSIAHAISLATAPVFLLTGVGAVLNVLASRLGRTIDRSRVLQTRDPALLDATTRQELARLQRRATLINWALGLCTGCALLVCSMIVTLFLALFVELDLTRIVAALFIAAMLCLIVALTCFFSEIMLATHKVRIAP